MKGLYMFKKGFTLAEVLITLTIIGVVSALTLPGLLTDTSTAQIGPKLAKARAMFEQANQALLHNENLDSFVLPSGLRYSSSSVYLDNLAAFLKISSFDRTQNGYAPSIVSLTGVDDIGNSSCVLSSDGMLYCVVLNSAHPYYDANQIINRQIIGTVYVDIDGPSGANVTGTDVFPFVLTAGGSITPVGATNWDNKNAKESTWSILCPKSGTVAQYSACTGHIFENNLKVEYN